jgi:hypothetical protein
MRRTVTLALVLAVSPWLIGCDDFAPPAELTAATVVGVRAEPPVVARGGETKLLPLIASPRGALDAAGATWRLTETLPGVPPFGQVIANPDGTATYRAPQQLPELPPNALPIDSVELKLELDGRLSTTLKAVLVTDAMAANPAIAAVAVDGVPHGDGDAAIELAAGAEVALSVATAPEASDRTTFAWYASVGSIEKYQSQTCTYLAKEPGSGWLFVVVREAQLGIAWRAIPLVVR